MTEENIYTTIAVPAPTGPCLSSAEVSRAGCRTPSDVSPEQNRGSESLPSTCWPCCSWCSPGYSWPSGLWEHIAGSCPVFHSSLPPSPSQQGYFQSFHPPASIDSRGCPHPGAGPCTWPCCTSWGPLLKLVQISLDSIQSFWCVICTTQLGVICRLSEGTLGLSVCVIDENVKQHQSQYRPMRDTTCHQHPSGHRTIDHYPLVVTIHRPIKSVSPQFREKYVVRDLVKGFTEVQIYDIRCFSLVHCCSHFITESHLVGQVGLALGETMLLSQITSCPPCALE